MLLSQYQDAKQWGKGTVENGNNFLSWTFPIKFVHAPFEAWLTHQNTTQTVVEAAINLPDITRAQIYTNEKVNSNTQFFILVIGFQTVGMSKQQ